MDNNFLRSLEHHILGWICVVENNAVTRAFARKRKKDGPSNAERKTQKQTRRRQATQQQVKANYSTSS